MSERRSFRRRCTVTLEVIDAMRLVFNPACSKSRKVKELLESRGWSPELIDYQEVGVSEALLEDIVRATGWTPTQLYRGESRQDIPANDEAARTAILADARRLQRPIVLAGTRGVVARPPERVWTLVPSAGLRIDATDAETILPVRHAVLCRGLPIDSARFDGDALETSRHAGAWVGNELAGSVTLIRSEGDTPSYQVRGPAVLLGFQGLGIGTALTQWANEQARALGDKHLWGNVRSESRDFYEKRGWKAESEPFDIEMFGPHYRMRHEF